MSLESLADLSYDELRDVLTLVNDRKGGESCRIGLA